VADRSCCWYDFTLRHIVVAEVVIEEDEWQSDREDEDRTYERKEAEPGITVGMIDEVGKMRERKFRHLLNRWRGRMKKRFSWICKGMILMKRVMQ
jgi:hypothetical protein